MALERNENLMLLKKAVVASTSNNNNKVSATPSNSPCWMNFASIRRQRTLPLMVCSIKGEITKLEFDAERFIDNGNGSSSSASFSIVGLKAERATPEFSGHKKLGFSLNCSKLRKMAMIPRLFESLRTD